VDSFYLGLFLKKESITFSVSQFIVFDFEAKKEISFLSKISKTKHKTIDSTYFNISILIHPL
jgi:hypothetical protein